MAIEWRVLGRPGRDNALHVTVDSGQSRSSLLFDCGEGVLDEIRAADVQSIEHLGFSHFHMDHVAGFDGFFRQNYNRPDVPVQVWGPSGTIGIMEHRLRGFVWNLHADQPGEWVVREVDRDSIGTARFFTNEAYAVTHRGPDRPGEGDVVFRADSWTLEARPLPHGSIDSLAYRVVESPRRNIDVAALKQYGYAPGPWLRAIVNEESAPTRIIELAGERIPAESLRERLMVSTPGESIAWLTDFRVEPGSDAWTSLVDWLSGTGVLVCECQYRDSDSALAAKNAHMSASLVGRLAKEAKVKRLVLQHLSRRYTRAEWSDLLAEVRHEFPAAETPGEWGL